MIVITGLDGSGKSTLLKKIEKELGQQISILRIPVIDSEKFKKNELLYSCCNLVNYLSERADREELPSLKIMSMFGSVLLFGELYHHLMETGVKMIFCERHPLIDTTVYAKAYSKVLHPDLLDITIAQEIEELYPSELKNILNRINAVVPVSGKGMCYDLLSFLSEWFLTESNFAIECLQKLFSINKPEMIYLLDAPAEVLADRLCLRKTREFHETEAALTKMRELYLNILPEIKVPFQIVDASNRKEPDILYRHLVARYS